MIFRDGMDQTCVNLIAFDGKNYRTRTVNVKGFDKVTVAGNSLERKLLSVDGGRYVSPEAQAIDEEIFFYVPDAKLLQTDAMLSAYVRKEVA